MHPLCLWLVSLQKISLTESFPRVSHRLPCSCTSDPLARAGAAPLPGLLWSAKDCLQGGEVSSCTVLPCPTCAGEDNWCLLPNSCLR